MARSGIVGRRSELAGFDDRLAAARGGRGRLVRCVGEPGIGKTRLAQAVADRARASGGTVVWGRCPEAEGTPPLWPLRQVLRSLGVDAEALRAGPARSPEDRFRLVADITDRLRDAAGADPGLLVVFDDVHRADTPTLLVLRQLADQLGTTPLLLVVTSRDDRVPALPAAERLQVRGFDVGEVREQLAAMGIDESRADEVHRVTAGNPLFVREVARAMAEGTWSPERPPRSVLDVVAGRLAVLSPACRGLLAAAAVAGLDFPLGLVAAARGWNVA
ncbi:MAG TPA: AAA family ATPase, partial [Pseudonocardiaceae bacterium]|nr:AAA family ATPase [Pseudonocardiaceae bacterium]